MSVVLFAATLSLALATPARTSRLDAAYSHLREGRLDRARTELRTAIAEGSVPDRALADLCYLDLRLNRRAEALAAGAAYLGRRPRDVRFRLDYALALASSDPDRARRELARLWYVPDAAVAQAARRASAVLAAPATVAPVSAPPEDPAYAQLALAYQQSALGRYADALATLDGYFALGGSDEHARLQRAYDLASLGRSAEARTAFDALSGSDTAEIAAAARAALALAGPAEAPADPDLVAAYDAVRDGREDAAAASFRAYLAAHPDDARAWHDFAYNAVRRRDAGEAAAAFDRYVALVPGDAHGELEAAYAAMALGQRGVALARFRALRNDADTAVARRAATELAAQLPTPPSGTTTELRVAWDSHLADTFYDAGARTILGRGTVQPYLATHVVRDARSHAGPVPAVYNDDAFVSAVGVQVEPIAGLRLFAEGGRYQGLVGQGTHASSVWGAGWHHRVVDGPRAVADADVSVAQYSYFAGNVIGYGALRFTDRVSSRVGVHAGLSAAADGRAFYYNNFAEASLGVSIGGGVWRVELDRVFGTYLRGAAPGGRSYWSTRPAVMITLHP